MAIQGSIEEAGLPDVLQLLALGRKTGCLVVIDGTMMQGQIFLDVGRVSYATVSNRPDRLGDMLLKSGRITRQQLDQAVAEQTRSSGHQIGRILVDAGSIDRAELEQFIRFQVEEAVYFLFTWKQGTFSFTSDRLPPHQSLLVPLDTESLLLEGARRVDEWSLIQKKIPSLDLVYRRSRETLGPAAEGLTEEQKRILPMLDGTLDVNGLVETTGMAEFDVGKALYGLVTAGLAQLVERRARVRHLEYRELLAYAVREAEYADPQRRKDAARHIVDCPICAEHLRTMHVRTTTGALPVAAAEEQPEPAGAVASKVPQSQRGPAAAGRSAAPTAGTVERRARERRAGSDRRKHDRRTGTDRRRAVNAAQPQAGAERRVGPRREEDQRTGDSRDRRSAERIQRGVQAAPAASAARSGLAQRPAEAGQPQAVSLRVEAAPHGVEPQVDVVADAALEPVGAKAGGSGPGPDAAVPAAPSPPAPPPPPPSSPEVAPARSGGSPVGGDVGTRGDLEWVVTPEESLEMIRGSRAQVRGVGGEVIRRGPQRVAPQAAPRPVNHARSPVGNGASVAASAGASLAGSATTLDRYAAGPGPASAGEGRKPGGPDAGRQAYPVKRLAIAAGITFVAALGFMAGQLGGRGGSRQVGGVTDAGPGSPAADSRQQAPVQSPAGESLAMGEGTPAESASQGAAAARPAPTSRRAAIIEPPARPAAEPVAPSRERSRPAVPAPVAVDSKPPATRPAAPPPAPTVGVIRGVVHDAGGRVLPGAHVSVRGSALTAVADGSGAFEIRDLPGGPVTVLASADGFISGSADVRVQAGDTVTADLALARPSTSEPDRELAAGGWAPVDRAEASSILGGTLGAIEGLPIESVAKSTTAARSRIRVAQLTQAGERIILTETRAGAAVRGAGPAIVTALRVMPPSEAYPWSTATASFGNILITVKTSVAAETLRSLLARLGEVPQGQ